MSEEVNPIKDYLFDFGATSVYFPKDSFFQKAAVHVEQKGDTLMVGQDLVPLKKPFDINFNVSEGRFHYQIIQSYFSFLFCSLLNTLCKLAMCSAIASSAYCCIRESIVT